MPSRRYFGRELPRNQEEIGTGKKGRESGFAVENEAYKGAVAEPCRVPSLTQLLSSPPHRPYSEESRV